MSLMRTRWAAIGAAVAVTLGGGGLVFVDAAQDSGERSVYNPIEPCRLIDTRPNKGIGGRTTPLGEGEALTVTAIGDSGECTGTTSDITAVQLNITPVLPTAATDLTVWPSGNAPNASSLNPAPGQPPTPNAVTTEVDGSGEFRIRNKFGNVHVIIDMVGFYRDHTHDDRYYTEDEIDAVMPFAVGADTGAMATQVFLTTTYTPVLSVAVTAPSDGQVTVTSSANVFHDVAGGDVACVILRSTDSSPSFGTNILGVHWFESQGLSANDGNIGGARVFDVVSESTTTFQLRCREGSDDGGRFFGGTMTAIFTPEAP